MRIKSKFKSEEEAKTALGLPTDYWGFPKGYGTGMEWEVSTLIGSMPQIGDMTYSMRLFTEILTPGLLFCSALGKYMQPRIVALAMEHGFDSGLPIGEVKEAFSYSTEDDVTDGDDWLEVVAEAETYLEDYAPEGFWAGYTEDGDFGVWECEKEGLPTLEEVLAELPEKTYLYNISRGDSIDLNTQGEAFEEFMNTGHGWEAFEEVMEGWEPCDDYYANQAFDKYRPRFEDEECEFDKAAFEEWQASLWDGVISEVRERDASNKVKYLLDNSQELMVRVSLGCDIPPAFYVDCFEYTDALKEVIDGLNINPSEFKRVAVEKGHICKGRWPNMLKRVAIVSIKDLIREMLHVSYSSALTILAKVDLYEVLKGGKEFTAEKGCIVGFHNSSCGSSSPFDAVLAYDLKLGKNWSFTPDTKGHGYSTYDVFGQRLDTKYIKNQPSTDK